MLPHSVDEDSLAVRTRRGQPAGQRLGHPPQSHRKAHHPAARRQSGAVLAAADPQGHAGCRPAASRIHRRRGAGANRRGWGYRGPEHPRPLRDREHGRLARLQRRRFRLRHRRRFPHRCHRPRPAEQPASAGDDVLDSRRWRWRGHRLHREGVL